MEFDHTAKSIKINKGFDTIMLNLTKTFKLTIVAAAAAFATQAGAHEVQSKTVTLPVIGAGDSAEVTITCPAHHYALSGGYENNDQLRGALGPLEVTASYAKSTRTWAVEFTNTSGRPTGAQEASVTISAYCDHHW